MLLVALLPATLAVASVSDPENQLIAKVLDRGRGRRVVRVGRRHGRGPPESEPPRLEDLVDRLDVLR